jgi:hypothetical protein
VVVFVKAALVKECCAAVRCRDVRNGIIGETSAGFVGAYSTSQVSFVLISF